MTALIDNPPLSYGVNRRKKRNVRIKKFEDGQSQRRKRGINAKRMKFTLVWEGISNAEVLLLEEFFDDLGGTDYFTWTTPEGHDGKWIEVEDTWNHTYVSYQNNTVRLDIEEVFDV